MKKGSTVSLLVILALVVVLPATAKGGEEVKAPAAAAATAPAAAAAPADGKALYAAKCAMCHGADGMAKKMAAGSANFNDAEWQKKTTAETIEKTVTEGKNKMTKWEGKLTAEQIKAVAAYVKTIK